MRGWHGPSVCAAIIRLPPAALIPAAAAILRHGCKKKYPSCDLIEQRDALVISAPIWISITKLTVMDSRMRAASAYPRQLQRWYGDGLLRV